MKHKPAHPGFELWLLILFLMTNRKLTFKGEKKEEIHDLKTKTKNNGLIIPEINFILISCKSNLTCVLWGCEYR